MLKLLSWYTNTYVSTLKLIEELLTIDIRCKYQPI